MQDSGHVINGYISYGLKEEAWKDNPETGIYTDELLWEAALNRVLLKHFTASRAIAFSTDVERAEEKEYDEQAMVQAVFEAMCERDPQFRAWCDAKGVTSYYTSN